MQSVFYYLLAFLTIFCQKNYLLSQNYLTRAEIEKKFNANKLINDKKPLSLQPQNIARLFVGFYSNEQSSADSSQSKEASLIICVPIWQQKRNKNKICWLYLSRAYVGRESRPFSQYVYRIEKRQDSLIAKIYTLEKEVALSNRFAWLEKQPLAKLNPDNLVQSLGCEFLISQNNKGFYIRPMGGDCPLTPPNQNVHALDLQFFVQPVGIESSVKFFDKNNQLIFVNPNQLYPRLEGEALSKNIQLHLELADLETKP